MTSVEFDESVHMLCLDNCRELKAKVHSRLAAPVP